MFQKQILNKYLAGLKDLSSEWAIYQEHFHNVIIQKNISKENEKKYQWGFLLNLFAKVLGYTAFPLPNYNLIAEQKNSDNQKVADGALRINEEVRAVIELKSTKKNSLSEVIDQAFGYKNHHRNCHYVIISNYEKLRFYIDNATEFIEFNLFNLSKDDFDLLYLCLAYKHIEADLPRKLKSESISCEEQITSQLYKDYSAFKRELFAQVCKRNSQEDKLLLFKKSQKLLDRFLFLFFAEDRGLLPPNWTRKILKDWDDLREEYNVEIPLYKRFIEHFNYLDKGHKDKNQEIFAYNGGLFQTDEVLDRLEIEDELLYKYCKKLSDYDFESDIDVNILGHIFEHSLSELEEVQELIKNEELSSQGRALHNSVSQFLADLGLCI